VVLYLSAVTEGKRNLRIAVDGETAAAFSGLNTDEQNGSGLIFGWALLKGTRVRVVAPTAAVLEECAVETAAAIGRDYKAMVEKSGADSAVAQLKEALVDLEFASATDAVRVALPAAESRFAAARSANDEAQRLLEKARASCCCGGNRQEAAAAASTAKNELDRAKAWLAAAKAAADAASEKLDQLKVNKVGAGEEGVPPARP
jgi:hypothetical protein